MREIKFRAWDKKNKYMDDDFFIHADNGYYEYASRRYNTPNIEIEKTENDTFELMQYTGLHDKNGVEIYEGDIVKRHGYTDYNYCFNVSEIIGTVVYEDCGFVVKHFDKDNKEIKYITPFFIELSEYPEAIKYYEVIGNIYENPELLEESEE